MNKNVKRIFLFTTVLMLLVTVSALNAADTNDNSTTVSTDVEKVSQDTAAVEQEVQTVDNKEYKEKTIKQDSQTHIVTNDNVEEIFNGDGYTLGDTVSEGDTLDFQGTIDQNHSIVINKPITVISSTQDAVISLHTVAGSYFGEDPGNSFVVNNGASGSYISGLYLNNTECWIYNVENAYFYNMTMHVENARVGSGVGQTAVRYCNNITLDNCHIYTENNGGSSSFVWTSTSNSTIVNSTVEGVGNVGNLLYVGNGFNTGDKPANYTIANFDNNVINCTITGGSGGISNPLQNTGTRTLIQGNKFYSGGGASSGTNGTLIGNEFYRTVGVSITANGVAINNTFYGTGAATIQANTKVYNNTFNRATISGANAIFENNTVKDLLTVSQPVNLQNNNLSAITLAANAKNSNISNNNITGAIAVNGVNITITDNLINTTNETAVVVTTDGVVVTNNTIYAIGKSGDDAVNTTKTTTVIADNQPESANFIITDENYYEYFNNEGLLINAEVPAYATLTLQGTFNNKSFTLTNISAVVKGDNAVLNNGQIVIDDTANVVITNITFQNTDIDSSIILNTDNNIVRNVKIIKTFTDAKAREIYITGNKNRVEYNTIEITGPSTPVDYNVSPNISPVIAIAVLSSSNTIQYNNITYTDTDSNTNGSSDLITVSGVLGEAQNNLVTRNNLTASGSGYIYGLNLGVNANNNNLTYNTLNITSSYYTYGVNILQVPMTNDRILYNNMYLKADNTAYGVFANVWGQPEATIFAINNNNINVEAENAYGAQIAGSPYSNIVFKNVNFTTNTINVTGKYAMGIGLYMTENVILNRNTLIITGETNETNTASWDSVKPTTVGVYSEDGNITRISNDIKSTVTNGPNVIYKNVNIGQINGGAFASDNINFILENVQNVNITSTKSNTTTDKSVQLTNSSNNIVRSNELRANGVGGDDAVYTDEDSTNNTISSNTPMMKLLTEDTYADLFDENATYTNTKYNTLVLGSDLYNKDLKFTNDINIENNGDYTIYNGTIYFMDTDGNKYTNSKINITGINFNNVNKSVIVDQLTNSQARSIYFYYANVTVTGDDVIVFDSQKDVVTDVYLNAEYNNITVEATNADIAKYIRPVNTDLDDYVDLENNNIKITADEDASVITVVGADMDFIYNNVNITAKNVVVVSNINGSANNFFYSDNTIYATGDNVTALILLNNGGSNPSIGRNTFTLSSSNPVTAIYSEDSTNVFVGIGRYTSSSYNRPNKFYIDATNGEVPVIIALGQNNSVRANTIITNDIYGDAAVQAAVVANNTPFEPVIIIDAPESIKVGQEVTVSAQVQNKTGKSITGLLVVKVDGEVVAEATSSSITATFTPTNANTTVTVEYTNTTSTYGPASNQTSLLDTKATVVELQTLEATAGETLTLNATFQDVYGNNITGGKAVFKINGVTVKDANGKVIYVKVVDGIAQIENITIPESWAGRTLNISVVYSGCSKADSVRYNTTLTVEEQQPEVEFTTTDITAAKADTITLAVKTNINDGKVVFKINGKTVKDANGKVIYAKITDNAASVTYTIPDSYKYKTYTVTAVYLYQSERIDINTTLTVVKE